jgi:hypothetical protein
MAETLSFREARPSGISYRLSDGHSGEITDPRVLRTFYTRIYLYDPEPRRMKALRRPRHFWL